MELNPVDFAIAVILFLGFVWGFSKGLMYMLFSLLAIIGGVIAGGKLSPLLTASIFPEKYYQVGYVVLFILLFTVVYFIIRKLSHLIESVVEFLELEWLDSLFGGLLGFAQFLIIAGIILNLSMSTGLFNLIPHSDTVKLGVVVTESSNAVIHFLAGTFNQMKVL